MSKNKELICWKVLTFHDGQTKRLAIYKEGSSTVIADLYEEYPVHPGSNSVDEEIKVLFSNVVNIETEYPGLNLK